MIIYRGMVTLRSTPCNLTEPVQIPKLCSTGRAPPRNTTIELSHIEVPPHYSAWPLFHNGVAAGLKLVAMGSTNIDSAWIVYNKPKVTKYIYYLIINFYYLKINIINFYSKEMLICLQNTPVF